MVMAQVLWRRWQQAVRVCCYKSSESSAARASSTRTPASGLISLFTTFCLFYGRLKRKIFRRGSPGARHNNFARHMGLSSAAPSFVFAVGTTPRIAESFWVRSQLGSTESSKAKSTLASERD
jgi:hypothetical protein